MYNSNILTNSYVINQAPARSRIGWQINLRTVNAFLVSGIVVSFLAFLIINNNLAVKSFALKDAKANLNELTWQNTELETKVTALSSYQYLSQKTSELKFVPANDVKYLPASNQFLAKLN